MTPRLQERASRLLIIVPIIKQPMHARRIPRIILIPAITMATEKQNIHPSPIGVFIRDSDQRGGFDERPVGDAAVEDLFGARDEVVAVCGGDFLDHDGGGEDGGDGVAAGAAVADAVAVDFVDEVLAAVGVLEAGWVDDAALAVGGGGDISVRFLWAGKEGGEGLLGVASDGFVTSGVRALRFV